MKRIASLMIAVGAGLLLAAAAHAEASKTGKVVEKSGLMNTLTIVTEDGERLTYETGDETAVMRDGRAVGLDAVAKGAQVKVTSSEDPARADEVHASRIELQPDVAAPPATRP